MPAWQGLSRGSKSLRHQLALPYSLFLWYKAPVACIQGVCRLNASGFSFGSHRVVAVTSTSAAAAAAAAAVEHQPSVIVKGILVMPLAGTLKSGVEHWRHQQRANSMVNFSLMQQVSTVMMAMR